ncbi:LuxR C-terminal-related transcriptional regulator [Paenarthrobacter sp. NPDC057355]|uniref:LuxR C-terminal-related transcriptional regulator n=1 Tax=Paenarthrobacter sp. NPDC057355 TaxID=3346105 RepID=UPI00363D4624
MSVPATALDLGRSAFTEHRWSAAFECLVRADDDGGLPPQDIELLASVAMLLGHNEEAIGYLTRAHNEYLTVGDTDSALRCAAWLIMFLLDAGEHARGSGWLGKANRLAESLEHATAGVGFLLISVALGSLRGGDAEAGYVNFCRAFELGESFNEKDLQAMGRLGIGTSRLALGYPEEGLRTLDELMVSVMAGEVSPIPTGIIYCAVLGSCRLAQDVGRAREWTAALERWCGERPDMVMFGAQCQAYRAELLILHGAWDQALEVARAAEGRIRKGDPDATFGAWYQEGEVFRLRGRAEETERAFRTAAETGFEPEPGMALLRLLTGRNSEAQARIRRAVAEADPGNRRRLLPALVDIELAVGETGAARAAVEELLAGLRDGSQLLESAGARQAEAAVLLAEGDAGAALRASRQAWRQWYVLEAPFKAACARVIAGRACAALGDADSAAMEFEAALEEFADLGAAPAIAEVQALRNGGGEVKTALTPRELEVLRLIAAGESNKAIARQLYLSEKTVARHAGNIFAKLGVGSRTAAASYAFENHLIG